MPFFATDCEMVDSIDITHFSGQPNSAVSRPTAVMIIGFEAPFLDMDAGQLDTVPAFPYYYLD